jgi:hypothetical protein
VALFSLDHESLQLKGQQVDLIGLPQMTDAFANITEVLHNSFHQISAFLLLSSDIPYELLLLPVSS